MGISNVSKLLIPTVQLKNTLYMTKLAELLFTLIAKRKIMEHLIHMLLGPKIQLGMVVQTILLEAMVVLNMLQSTNAREHMKQNVIQLHVPYPQNIVRIEKRRYVKS